MNTKLHKHLSIITFFICSLIPLFLHGQEESKPTQQESSWLEKHGEEILVIECFLTALIIADKPTRKILLEQLTPVQMAKTICQEYTAFATANISHECGHAMAANLLHGDPIALHLGATTPSDSSLKLVPSVTIEGVRPNCGWATYKNHFPKSNPSTRDKRKRFAVLAAGGMCGVAGYLLRKFIFKHVKQTISSFETVLDWFSPDHWTPTCSAITAKHVRSLIMPYSFGHGVSDGFALLHDVAQIPRSLLERISLWVPLADLAAEISILMAHRSTELMLNPITVCLLAVVNYYAEGFFRFHL